MVHVHQLYMSFVLSSHGSQVTPHPSPYVTPCQFHSLSKFLWHALSIESDSTTVIYFPAV